MYLYTTKPNNQARHGRKRVRIEKTVREGGGGGDEEGDMRGKEDCGVRLWWEIYVGGVG